MAEFPILPIRTDALLADTMDLTTEEFGAYCRILFVMWRQGGRLPHNPDQLRRIAGCHAVRWTAIGDTVMRPFTIADGLVTQKRLTATLLDVREVRKKRAIAGSRGNAVRWGPKVIKGGLLDGIKRPHNPLE